MEKFGVWHKVEQIFDGPDVVIARDGKRVSFWPVKGSGVIVFVNVDVGESGGRQDSRIQSNLTGHPLRLQLSKRGRSACQKNDRNKTGQKCDSTTHRCFPAAWVFRRAFRSIISFSHNRQTP